MAGFAAAAVIPLGITPGDRQSLLMSLLGGVPVPKPGGAKPLPPIPITPGDGGSVECSGAILFHDDGKTCTNGTQFDCGGPKDSGTLMFACDGGWTDDFECTGTFDCHTSFTCQDSFDASDCATDFECIACNFFSDPGGDTKCKVP